MDMFSVGVGFVAGGVIVLILSWVFYKGSEESFRGLSKHHAGFGNEAANDIISGFISAIVAPILKWVGGVVLVIGLVIMATSWVVGS
ncbi:hypothetical protein H6784_04290 [Candidatus Nomurabacteria bacterium]|nr:hypothetical protein [Candidatus Kaiserbacteria bacterium]MCB9814607.1 hypothetical protein [Candidatus Nomurabacteria bacterium]